MPKYQCHKKVWALKIKQVNAPTGNDLEGSLEFEDPRYALRSMPLAYFDKHKPEAGGYFVQYEDGYCSFSPGKEFEEGYTLIK